jgi:hypothetical protein
MFALKFVNDMRMVQTSGKMLIASNSTIVGLMNSQAMAPSDIPAFTVVTSGRAGATKGALKSVALIVWFTARFLGSARPPGNPSYCFPASLKSFAQSFTRLSSACFAVPLLATT